MKKSEMVNQDKKIKKSKKEVADMSIIECVKMMEHNEKIITRLSVKIDRLQNINIEIKEQLKKMLETK